MESAEKRDDWVARLTRDETERNQTIKELRDLLVRGLTKSLSARLGLGLQVEDVVQDALVKILASLDKFEGRSRFTTWAMTIATRVGISELRRRHYREVSLNTLNRGGHLRFEITVGDDIPIGDKLDRLKLLEMLRQLIDSELTEKQRLSIQALLTGMPVEEIARRTRSHRNAVYKLIHDARVRIRNGFGQADLKADDINVVFA